MEAALIVKLLASAGVTALVSTSINWVLSPQGTPSPRVVLTRIGGEPDYHHGGGSGLVVSRIQADCYGVSYGSAKAVARAIEAAVCGVSFTQGAVRFDVILLDAERDGTSQEGPDTLFRTSIDLMVHHASAS